MYFPTVYDIKHLMKFCNSLHGGLNKLAELLEVERIGICHQAGSDSLLTSCTFRKLKDNFFSGSLEKYAGVLVQVDLQFPVKKQANNAEANLSVAGYCMSVPCDAKPDMCFQSIGRKSQECYEGHYIHFGRKHVQLVLLRNKIWI
ncbi:hypothetical protein ACSQ67_021827 [Phaseolus vulgaris]